MSPRRRPATATAQDLSAYPELPHPNSSTLLPADEAEGGVASALEQLGFANQLGFATQLQHLLPAERNTDADTDGLLQQLQPHALGSPVPKS